MVNVIILCSFYQILTALQHFFFVFLQYATTHCSKCIQWTAIGYIQVSRTKLWHKAGSVGVSKAERVEPGNPATSSKLLPENDTLDRARKSLEVPY